MTNRPQGYLKKTDQLIPRGLFKTIHLSLERYGFWGSFARYLLMRDEIDKFINRPRSDNQKLFRKKLIQKFGLIQKKVPCAHSPFQFILMAEYIFNLKAGGPIIQCGCFKGGSTAKLSIIAQKTKRRLYVCDSFQGLPGPQSKKESFLKGYGDFPNFAFSAGEYKGSLKEVQNNVKRYGKIDQCQFIPGLFKQTLPKLNIRPALVFIDVDLISSAKDCLQSLWPRLVPGGYWFTHEATFPQYIQGILDPQWWHDVLGELPPVIIGAGRGLSPLAEGIAYFQK